MGFWLFWFLLQLFGFNENSDVISKWHSKVIISVNFVHQPAETVWRTEFMKALVYKYCFFLFFFFFSFWCHIPPAEQSKQNCSSISTSLNHGRECCRDTSSNQSPWKQWHHLIRGRTKLLNFINKLRLSPISCSTRNYIKSLNQNYMPPIDGNLI